MILEIIKEYGMEILGAILTGIAGALGLAIKNLAAKYLNDITKRGIARDAAAFVEQVWKTIHGPDKLKKALEVAEKLLQKKGVPFDAEEMEILIEAAVAEFNDAFNAPTVLEGIAVEDLDDDQLRSLLQQMGYAYTDGMTREEMLAALDETPEAPAKE